MEKAFSILLAKAASDPELLKKLQDEKLVRSVLKEHGIDVSKIPEDIKIEFIQEPEKTKIIVVPNSKGIEGLAGGEDYPPP